MGCVPSRTYSRSRTQRRSTSKIPLLRSTKGRGRGGHHHPQHHFVALTSTTYGLWKGLQDDLTDRSAFTTPGTELYTSTGTEEDGKATRSASLDFSDANTNYEDCCTDKEVLLGIVESSPNPVCVQPGIADEGCEGADCFLVDLSGGEPSVSSSSSCVNKLVTFDPFHLQQDQQQKQNLEVIDISDLMEGLEEESSRLLTPIFETPKKKSCGKLSSGGKRRSFYRSSSLSATQRKLDNAFSTSDIPPGFERLLRDIFNFYISSSGGRKSLTRPSDPLDAYKIRCPPGGESSVVFYYTSLRGVRRTFEDCHNLEMILRSFGVVIDERDVSMHAEFKNELKVLLRNEPVTIPKLFIKGRLIGGLTETRRAHEEGTLIKMLEDIPKDDPSVVCDGCGSLKFLPCLECSGSCKLVNLEEEGGVSLTKCPDCNENGLIRCPICC